MKLTVKCLLCSTQCLSFSQHFCQLDAMFVSRGRMTSLFRFISSEYTAPQSRILGIHSVYSRIGIATQSNGCSGLFHLFLFRNKVNRTHPKSAFFYSQFWNENGQKFFYFAFLFRNGQNAIPSILLPGAE